MLHSYRVLEKRDLTLITLKISFLKQWLYARHVLNTRAAAVNSRAKQTLVGHIYYIQGEEEDR